MTYRHVALMGKARSGKDSIAEHLVRQYQFTRVSFADPLREMALRVDPWVNTATGVHVRLLPLVLDVGWEYAKTTYPEVRRLLQTMGQTVRDYDEDFWCNIAMDKIDAASKWGLPVVVTDCRYPNEAEALKARGFLMVTVERPDLEGLSGANGAHESETALADYLPDRVIVNNGTLRDLAWKADSLVQRTH